MEQATWGSPRKKRELLLICSSIEGDFERLPGHRPETFCCNCTRRDTGPPEVGGQIRAGTRSGDHDTGRDGTGRAAEQAAELAQLLLYRPGGEHLPGGTPSCLFHIFFEINDLYK